MLKVKQAAAILNRMLLLISGNWRRLIRFWPCREKEVKIMLGSLLG